MGEWIWKVGERRAVCGLGHERLRGLGQTLISGCRDDDDRTEESKKKKEKRNKDRNLW